MLHGRCVLYSLPSNIATSPLTSRDPALIPLSKSEVMGGTSHLVNIRRTDSYKPIFLLTHWLTYGPRPPVAIFTDHAPLARSESSAHLVISYASPLPLYGAAVGGRRPSTPRFGQSCNEDFSPFASSAARAARWGPIMWRTHHAQALISRPGAQFALCIQQRWLGLADPAGRDPHGAPLQMTL